MYNVASIVCHTRSELIDWPVYPACLASQTSRLQAAVAVAVAVRDEGRGEC